MAGWSRVQIKTNATGASGSSRAVTMTSTASGSVLVVGVVAASTSGSAPSVLSITDDRSNAYSKLVALNDSLTGHRSEVDLWYSLAPLSGVTTITVTMSGTASNYLDAYAAEYTPPASSTLAAESANNNNFGNGTSITPGSITTTGSNDLVLVMALVPSAQSVGSGFSLASKADGNAFCDLLNAPSGSYNPAIASSVSNPWDAVIGAISATAAAPSGGLEWYSRQDWLENSRGLVQRILRKRLAPAPAYA